MATQTLKYGTIVLLGLAVTGGIYYESARHQVYAKDCIEIIEGVREREMIATAISGTNRITLQIATNRSSLVALDSVIVGLIPYFVNQEEISTWASGATTNPPHWTPEDLYTHVGLSSSGMTPYPYQIRTNELWERFNILKHLVYTDTASAWNATRGGDVSVSLGGIEFGGQSTNFAMSEYTQPFPTEITNHDRGSEWWETNGAPTEPTGWWTDCYSHEKTVAFDGYTIASSFSATYPQFSWAISIPMTLQIRKGASFDNSRPSGSRWDVFWSTYWLTQRSYSSSYRESNLASTTRSIPITRTDYFYTDTLLCTTNVSANTAVSTSTFVVPPGTFNPSLTHSREECVLDDFILTPYSSGYVLIDFSSTNNAPVTKSDSGSVSNNVLRNCIHKWDVERCRE